MRMQRIETQLKKPLLTAALTLLLSGCLFEGSTVDTPPEVELPPAVEIVPPTEWTLVWEDNFDGTSLNTDSWNIETGDGTEYGLPAGWGNNEQQWYSGDNITLSEGNLVITAKEEPTGGMPYTSGRMLTKGKVDFKYGRLEARIKVPVGQGLWSAFWALPTDDVYGGWPNSGEIDVMEVVNANADSSETFGTLHYGMAWPQNVLSSKTTPIQEVDEFHTYTVEWEQDEIRWFLDGVHYATVHSDHWWSYFFDDAQQRYVSAPDNAPFNQNFHLLLNLAVGGNLPGSPDAQTVFPAQMMVDYVKVSRCDEDPATGVGCASNTNPTIDPPGPADVFTTSYSLYTGSGEDQISWTIASETLSRGLKTEAGWTNDGALTYSQVESGDDHGTVLDVLTTNGGNMVINAVDGGSFSLTGMGNAAEAWKAHAGLITFDLFIDSANTPDDGSILVKMDSGWPALGFKSFAVADLPKDSWTTMSVKVNDLLATSGEQPLDVNNVDNLFVLEFTSQAHVQVDNVTLSCGHPNACGIAPPAVEVTFDTVELFTEQVNTELWTNGIGAWDTTAGNYLDGETANHISWSVIDSGDSDHGNVISTVFNADGGNGVFYIQSVQNVDLTHLSVGELIFDIKVTNYGSNTDGMTLKVDCTDPCSTGDIPLGVIGDGQWETITLPVTDLVARGLELDKINSGIVLFPAWDQQQGVTFELDNIRWQVADVGEVTPPTTPDPDAEAALLIYGDAPHADWPLWDCCGGASFTELADEDAEHGTVAEFTFGGAGGTVVGFIGSNAFDASGISGGTLEFDLKVLAEPNEGGLWTLKVESNADVFAELLLSESNEGALPGSDWQHFTYDLATLAGAGLNIGDINVIMIFPTWAKAQGAVYRIDNVMINP
ncbi:MAG: beta-glucanase (GH16 family) [Alteromonadaceae bacterium]|jgi:beta-glucanase (GH16 family)